MKLGYGFHLDPKEVLSFSVERLTSVDVRMYITFKNRTSTWLRVSEEDIRKLENFLDN